MINYRQFTSQIAFGCIIIHGTTYSIFKSQKERQLCTFMHLLFTRFAYANIFTGKVFMLLRQKHIFASKYIQKPLGILRITIFCVSKNKSWAILRRLQPCRGLIPARNRTTQPSLPHSLPLQYSR